MSERIRAVEVVPPRRSREEFYVMLACSTVVLAALWWILATRPAPGVSMDALPFQIMFQELPSGEQRTLRALLDGEDEAKRRRDAEGAWPSVERLAQDQIPPFAPDVLDRAGYRWSMRREGLLLNYAGAPDVPGSPDFLLLIQEPDPASGELTQAGVVDEEHQRLSDGKLLHVTYWKRAQATRPATFVTRPEVEGWTQIRLKAR